MNNLELFNDLKNKLEGKTEVMIKEIVSNEYLWDTNLNLIPELADCITNYYFSICCMGMKSAYKNYVIHN